jgi:hypothetical protein
MSTTPLLEATLMSEGQTGAYALFNELARRYEIFALSGRVLDRDATSPPGGESEGDAYLLPGSGCSGDWSGEDGNIAVYIGGGYEYITPIEGMRLWVADEDITIEYDGSSWTSTAWDGDVADIDIDGATDIGADLADADLLIVDDGAGGTNRKSAISRLWTYIWSKISGATTKSTPVDADTVVVADSEASDVAKAVALSDLADYVRTKKIEKRYPTSHISCTAGSWEDPVALGSSEISEGSMGSWSSNKLQVSEAGTYLVIAQAVAGNFAGSPTGYHCEAMYDDESDSYNAVSIARTQLQDNNEGTVGLAAGCLGIVELEANDKVYMRFRTTSYNGTLFGTDVKYTSFTVIKLD